MKTARKKQFIEEWFVDFNETQAAIRAGYSKRSARQIGSRLMTDDDIVDGIKIRGDELMKHIKANQIQTLMEIRSIAYISTDDILFNTNWNLIKVSDKLSALEKLAKIQGILGDTNINLPGGGDVGIMYYPNKVEVGAPVDMKLLEAGNNGDNDSDNGDGGRSGEDK